MIHSIQFNPIQFNSIQINSIQFNSIDWLGLRLVVDDFLPSKNMYSMSLLFERALFCWIARHELLDLSLLVVRVAAITCSCELAAVVYYNNCNL